MGRNTFLFKTERWLEPIGSRRQAVLLFEGFGEMGRVDETATSADFLHGQIGAQQKLRRLFQFHLP